MTTPNEYLKSPPQMSIIIVFLFQCVKLDHSHLSRRHGSTVWVTDLNMRVKPMYRLGRKYDNLHVSNRINRILVADLGAPPVRAPSLRVPDVGDLQTILK